MNIDECRAKYEREALVAFIDILGFQSMVKNGMREEILEFLYLIRNFNAEYQADLHITQEAWLTGKVQPRISSFSDHIIISLPFELTDFPENFNNRRSVLFHHLGTLNEYITHFQLLGLERNILLRGAIALGPHYHDWENNLIYGSPLIESITYETKLATYPRVVLAESLLINGANIFNIPEDESHMHPISSAFRLDFDGLFHVDYLELAFTLFSENKLTEVKGIIEKGIKDSQNNFNILTKWKWLASYFNTKTVSFKTPEQPKPSHIYKNIDPIPLRHGTGKLTMIES